MNKNKILKIDYDFGIKLCLLSDKAKQFPISNTKQKYDNKNPYVSHTNTSTENNDINLHDHDKNE